ETAALLDRDLAPSAEAAQRLAQLTTHLVLRLEVEPVAERILAAVLELRQAAQHVEEHGLLQVLRVVARAQPRVEPIAHACEHGRPVATAELRPRGVVSAPRLGEQFVEPHLSPSGLPMGLFRTTCSASRK